MVVWLYTAFGLTWQMPLVCPELRPAKPRAAPDVVIAFGEAPPDAVGLSWSGVARLAARGGKEIFITREAATSDEMIRLLLLGPGVDLLLHQRGLLPLHASAIVGPTGAVLFMGHSGVGKSTLLNEFMRRGYPMLAEDLAAVRLAADGAAWVEPGVQVTRLWADSVAVLGQTTAGLPRAYRESEKFVLPVVAALADTPARLAAIYLLGAHHHLHIGMEERRDARKFDALWAHTRQRQVLKEAGLHIGHFERAAAVANQTRILAVHRPVDGFRLTELADAIETDFHAYAVCVYGSGRARETNCDRQDDRRSRS